MTYNSCGQMQNRWFVVEGVSFGLAYGASLLWGSVCLVASFRPYDLSAPYWSDVPNLRSDTSGIVSFIAVAIFLTCGKFLFLRRRRGKVVSTQGSLVNSYVNISILAVTQTITFLATGLFVYLSVNTVTHPETLSMSATHLASWPTEGTLRVIALLMCVCSFSLIRFLEAKNEGSVNLGLRIITKRLSRTVVDDTVGKEPSTVDLRSEARPSGLIASSSGTAYLELEPSFPLADVRKTLHAQRLCELARYRIPAVLSEPRFWAGWPIRNFNVF